MAMTVEMSVEVFCRPVEWRISQHDHGGLIIEFETDPGDTMKMVLDGDRVAYLAQDLLSAHRLLRHEERKESQTISRPAYEHTEPFVYRAPKN